MLPPIEVRANFPVLTQFIKDRFLPFFMSPVGGFAFSPKQKEAINIDQLVDVFAQSEKIWQLVAITNRSEQSEHLNRFSTLLVKLIVNVELWHKGKKRGNDNLEIITIGGNNILQVLTDIGTEFGFDDAQVNQILVALGRHQAPTEQELISRLHKAGNKLNRAEVVDHKNAYARGFHEGLMSLLPLMSLVNKYVVNEAQAEQTMLLLDSLIEYQGFADLNKPENKSFLASYLEARMLDLMKMGWSENDVIALYRHLRFEIPPSILKLSSI